MGINYLTECLAASVTARRREAAYRVYVTDCLYALCAWTGNRPRRRFADWLDAGAADGRTGEEIAIQRLKGMGLTVRDEERREASI